MRLLRMPRYRKDLKLPARRLRSEMTDSERALWSRLRCKQVMGIQVYRQKPIGDYVVDFYLPKAKLVIEVDGAQHMEVDHIQRDAQRDDYLNRLGLRVLRYSNLEVLGDPDAVLEDLHRVMQERIRENPPRPPFGKGGGKRESPSAR
jgi:very-short-patch-repair endonuclease